MTTAEHPNGAGVSRKHIVQSIEESLPHLQTDYKGKRSEIGFAFLAGGAIGNGIDRLLFGRVTDFLVSHSGNSLLNIADHAIEVGLFYSYSISRFGL